MQLREMQENLPWTIPYSEAFQMGKQEYSDLQHALIHIIKSAGILAARIDRADHGDTDAFAADLAEIHNRTADFVMCALRIANTAPIPFDLETAVILRIEAVNGVRLT